MPRRGNARQGPNPTGVAVCFASTSRPHDISTAGASAVGAVSPENACARLRRIGERILEVEGVLSELRQLAAVLEARDGRTRLRHGPAQHAGGTAAAGR